MFWTLFVMLKQRNHKEELFENGLNSELSCFLLNLK